MENNVDLSQLQNNSVRAALQEIITKDFKATKYSIKIEEGSAKGDNYISVVYRVRVLIESSEIFEKSTVKSIIIKLPPENKTRRDQFFARPCFLRESLVYQEILPFFMKFQENKGITLEERFHEVPICWRTLTEEGYEAIFLEDLKLSGFEMHNRHEEPTFTHVEMVMKALAKFHAISFALKDQCPDKLSKYQKLEEIFYERRNDTNLKLYFDSLKTRALETLQPGKDDVVIDKFNNYFKDREVFDILLALTNGKEAEPYAVLCHGDCWNNNMLFKHVNGIPTHIRLIDWQVVRYASPVDDLMYYIFICTTKKLREKYYATFIDIYYQQICTSLTNLGSNPEAIFPRKALDDQLKKFGSYALITGMMLLPIITTYSEDIPDLDEMSEKLNAGSLDLQEAFKPEQTFNIYVERMRSLIIDLEQLGYI